MEVNVTNVTTSVEIEAGYDLFEVVIFEGSEENARQYAIEAALSAADALDYANQAEADKVQTGLDRIATGADAIATSADRVQTGLDADATAADVVQTGLDRIATAVDRVQTGLDVIAADLSASNALDSENAAELAASTIVDKIDFTGAVEGDLYRVNALGVAVPINETEFLKSKVPFLNSPLAGFLDLDNLFAWDSFSRPNTASTLIADSGQSYIQFSGSSGLRIENNYAYKNNFSDIIGVNTGFGSVRFVNNVRIRPANSNNSFIIGKDANNYIFYEFNSSLGDGIRVSIVIGGVATLLSAQNFYTVFGLSNGLLLGSSAIVTFIIDLIRPSEGGMVLRINCPTVPNLNQYVDLSSYRASDYPNASDIAYVGWGTGNNGDRTRISSWSVFNIIS